MSGKRVDIRHEDAAFQAGAYPAHALVERNAGDGRSALEWPEFKAAF